MSKKTKATQEAIPEPQTPPQAAEPMATGHKSPSEITDGPRITGHESPSEITDEPRATGHKPPSADPIEAKPVYDFSHGRRCPRCQTTDTLCRSTQGGIQYRKCLRAVCKHNYSVVGVQK